MKNLPSSPLAVMGVHKLIKHSVAKFLGIFELFNHLNRSPKLFAHIQVKIIGFHSCYKQLSWHILFDKVYESIYTLVSFFLNVLHHFEGNDPTAVMVKEYTYFREVGSIVFSD